MRKELEELVAVLLDDFYGQAIDWRQVLKGESLALDASVAGNNGEVTSIAFKSDGVRQVAPPQPFDAVACADVIRAYGH